jgi:hypothetical protein
MRKRWVWVFFGAAVIAGAFALLAASKSLPTIRFSDGTSTRILKVEVSTNHVFAPEPFWQTSCRRFLPQTFGKYFGQARHYTCVLYDTLAIHLEPLLFRNGTRRSNMRVEMIFPDGTTSYSYWGNGPHVYPLVFRNYPRDQKQLHLRFCDGNQPIDVMVSNPRPIQRASWSARSLPQTNAIPGTEVVLQYLRHPAHSSILATRSRIGGSVGWMQWRMCLFDPLGNWEPTDPFPGAKNERFFKLVAEGSEYISGGSFPVPVSQQYQVIPLTARMTNWGVCFVALFGPGNYEVSKTFEIKVRNAGLATTNVLKAARSSWLVECVQPVTLAISERPVFDVRLRERLPEDWGRIFDGRLIGSLCRGPLTAQLFAPRLPPNTTNFEPELVVRWPAVEFFVQKPE